MKLESTYFGEILSQMIICEFYSDGATRWIFQFWLYHVDC